MLNTYIKKIPICLLLLITALLMNACSRKSSLPVVNADEVRTFLAADNSENTYDKQLEETNKRIQFLNIKMEQDNSGPVTAGLLAGALSQRFEITGDINDIVSADSLLHIANTKFNGSKATVLQSLSANALKRHEFKASLEYAFNAYELGEHKSISAGMMFDAAIETGSYLQAENLLRTITNKNEFSYLIRASKLKQAKGETDSAVIFMEMALENARKNTGNTAKMTIKWAENTMAMLYYNNEEYEKAYELYISSLRRERNNYKALEGIALIAAVNDKNYKLAEDIQLFLASRLLSPDPYLNLYKISKLTGNAPSMKRYLDEFITRTKNPKYGKMYNRYLAEIYTEEYRDFDEAKSIALQEIDERPSPASYYLLAWINSKQGDNKTAIEIIKNFVEGKTHDPSILSGIEKIYFEETKRM